MCGGLSQIHVRATVCTQARMLREGPVQAMQGPRYLRQASSHSVLKHMEQWDGWRPEHIASGDVNGTRNELWCQVALSERGSKKKVSIRG